MSEILNFTTLFACLFIICCKFQRITHNSLVMECYATLWRLWRDSRLLWHIVVLSFVFECLSSVSLPPSFVSLFAFGGLMPVCRPEGQGTAIRAFIELFLKQPLFKQNQKEHTIVDFLIKEGIVNYNSLLY